MDSDIPLQKLHQKFISSASYQSQKNKGEHKTNSICHDVCGERNLIEKVQAANIDRSNEVKKLNILEDSCSEEQNIAFRYSREGIGYNVPELGSPENLNILKRREKSTNYSLGLSTADSIPKRVSNENLQAMI